MFLDRLIFDQPNKVVITCNVFNCSANGDVGEKEEEAQTFLNGKNSEGSALKAEIVGTKNTGTKAAN